MQRHLRKQDIVTSNLQLNVSVIGCRGRLEFNPSRIAYPDTTELITWNRLADATSVAWIEARHILTPLVPLVEASVTRLDLARDFVGAVDLAAIINGMYKIHRPWGRDPSIHYNHATLDPQSLQLGSKERRIVIYNKDVESRGRAPDGTVRWEAQLHTRPLRRAGIHVFGDVTEELINKMAVEQWAWSRMDTEIHTSVDVWSIINDLPGLPDATKRTLYWDLVAMQRGQAAPNYRRRRSVNEFIADYGILGTDDQGGFTQRLDWNTGTVVATKDALEDDLPPLSTKDQGRLDQLIHDMETGALQTLDP